MIKQLYLGIFCLTLIFVSCKNTDTSTSDIQVENSLELGYPDWLKDATLYEVNTRQFSEEGSFDAITSQVPRLKEMGIDILWLMPIHPISEKKRKATNDKEVEEIEDPEERKKYLGSPYAVGDYKGLNPDYGTAEDFKELVSALHNNDMKVIIDWVPNHTGWDNPWIESNPEWYTQDSLGNIIDPIDYNTGKSWGWTDVADLNFDNQEMRLAMIDALQFWLTEYDIDGFRIDVAHGIPQDFWDQMTPELIKTKKDIFLLAESQVPSHRNNNTYHATYGWDFHHLMNHIAKGEKKAKDIVDWYNQDKKKFNKGGFHIHFTSNHDENTWAGTVFDRMGDAHKTLAVLAATLEGMPLIYNGQEEPLKKRLQFFVKDPIEWGDYAYADFYKSLFELKHNNPALWNGGAGGDPEFLMADEDVLVYKRQKDNNEVIVLLNLSAEDQQKFADFSLEGYTAYLEPAQHVNEDGILEMRAWEYAIYTK
ncbi:MAG: alpha-amylase [Saprospiraceae bacterium]|nr:alpha-amylase [Saprospiraceae bacterium]